MRLWGLERATKKTFPHSILSKSKLFAQKIFLIEKNIHFSFIFY